MGFQKIFYTAMSSRNFLLLSHTFVHENFLLTLHQQEFSAIYLLFFVKMHGGGYEDCCFQSRVSCMKMITQEDDLLQFCQEKITYSSTEFFRNEQYMSADSFSSSSTRKRPVSSFSIIPPQIITTELLCWRRIPIAQLSPLKTHLLVKPSGSFGDALDWS